MGSEERSNPDGAGRGIVCRCAKMCGFAWVPWAQDYHPDFCLRLSRFPNLCPQFHLSLQSGSDTVLVRMRRKYDTARYAQSVALLRESFPGCALTTDLIVGFPGETEAELEESLAFAGSAALRRCIFSPLPPSRYPCGQDAGAADQGGKKRPAAPGPLPSPGRWSKPICLRKSEPHRKCFWEESVGEGLYTGHTPHPHQGLRAGRRFAQPNLQCHHHRPLQGRTPGAVLKSYPFGTLFSRSGAQKVL